MIENGSVDVITVESRWIIDAMDLIRIAVIIILVIVVIIVVILIIGFIRILVLHGGLLADGLTDGCIRLTLKFESINYLKINFENGNDENKKMQNYTTSINKQY